MHLWPSMRIRDSFKINYLKKLEWNLDRMNSQKNQNQNQSQESTGGNREKLLDERENAVDNGKPLSKHRCLSNCALIFREVAMVLSCCYCCFCCGACVDEGEE